MIKTMYTLCEDRIVRESNLTIWLQMFIMCSEANFVRLQTWWAVRPFQNSLIPIRSLNRMYNIHASKFAGIEVIILLDMLRNRPKYRKQYDQLIDYLLRAGYRIDGMRAINWYKQQIRSVKGIGVDQYLIGDLEFDEKLNYIGKIKELSVSIPSFRFDRGFLKGLRCSINKLKYKPDVIQIQINEYSERISRGEGLGAWFRASNVKNFTVENYHIGDPVCYILRQCNPIFIRMTRTNSTDTTPMRTYCAVCSDLWEIARV